MIPRLYNRVRKTSAHAIGGTGGGIGIPQKRGSVPAMLSSNLENQILVLPQPPKGKSFVGLPDLKEIAEEDHSEDHSREGSAPPSTQPNHLTPSDGQALDSFVDGNDNNAQLSKRKNSTIMTKIGSSMLIVDEMTQSRILRVSSRVSLTKPMYRDDIFYTGSLLRLPQYADNVG